jgi:hypothetical protein
MVETSPGSVLVHGVHATLGRFTQRALYQQPNWARACTRSSFGGYGHLHLNGAAGRRGHGQVMGENTSTWMAPLEAP